MYSARSATDSGIPYNHIMRLTTQNLPHRAHGNPFGWTLNNESIQIIVHKYVIKGIQSYRNKYSERLYILYSLAYHATRTFKHYLVDIIYMRKEYIFLHNKSMIYMYWTCLKTHYTRILVGITLLLLNRHGWWSNDEVIVCQFSNIMWSVYKEFPSRIFTYFWHPFITLFDLLPNRFLSPAILLHVALLIAKTPLLHVLYCITGGWEFDRSHGAGTSSPSHWQQVEEQAPKHVGWMMCFLLMTSAPVQKLCVNIHIY